MFRSRATLTGSAAVFAICCSTARADLSISKKPTQNVTCSGGTCTATSSKAVLNATDLQTMLAAGDVAVKTGAATPNLQVVQGFSWTSSSRLTLDARQSITFRKAVTVAGSGALALTYNDGGSGGDLIFEKGGGVQFWDVNSNLAINGTGYVLVGDIATLASKIAANAAGSYALAKSYDAKSDGTYTAAPITTEFAGSFTGLGNSIANVTIKAGSSKTGFFSAISESGVVRDFGLQHAKVTIPKRHSGQMVLGALAGENRGAIISSFATGSLDATTYIDDLSAGGLAGRSTGLITGSHADVKVTTPGNAYYNRIGGLVGFLDGTDNPSAALLDSYASGSVRVPSFGSAGGLIGYVLQATVARSHASGNVSGGQESRVGGLIGLDGYIGNIDSSFATGAVATGSGRSHCYASAGGLIGSVPGPGEVISNSYAMGSVNGGDQACVGGLFGDFAHTGATVQTSYSIGAVSGGTAAQVGGVIGRDKAKYTRASDSYWDIDTSGTSQAVGNTNKHNGLKGLSTGEFMSQLPAGFDPKTWGQLPGINNGYPYLLANPPQ